MKSIIINWYSKFEVFMKKLIGILLSTGAVLSVNAAPKNMEKQELIPCESSKEYVTTVEFLRDKKDFGLKTIQIYKIADEISKGCTGASQRFFKVTGLLTRVGIDSSSAISHAKKFAFKDDSFVNAFITIFKQTYSQDSLDLDALNSMKISLQLSVEFDGNIESAVKDFDELVNFCKDRKEMDLPLPQCAKLATQVTRLGQKYEEQIAGPFIDLVKFLEESSRGPKEPKNNVLKIAKDVIQYGPIASKNFINAYKYAIDKDKLGMTEPQAIAFGKKMASRSFKIK